MSAAREQSKVVPKKDKRWQERFKQFLQRALELRGELEKAEARLMYYLVEWEAKPNTWKCGEYPTFSDVLRRNCIIEVSRYDRFKKASKVIPIRTVSRIGVPGTLEAARILNPEHRDAMIIALDTFRKEQGTVASYETARRYRKDITGERSMPAPLVRETKRIELKKQIAVLKTEVMELRRALKVERAKTEKLTRERDRLQKKLERSKKK
jgi:hypothetical protein